MFQKYYIAIELLSYYQRPKHKQNKKHPENVFYDLNRNKNNIVWKICFVNSKSGIVKYTGIHLVAQSVRAF